MQLSRNFTLAEFTRSGTATAKGIDNTAPDWAVRNLRALCEYVLQPVRDRFGPVKITSGWRCQELERALKGKPLSWTSASQHTFGEAADFKVPGVSNVEVADWITENCDFDQLILEYPDGTPNGGWIHCSALRNARVETLTASRDRNGRTVYTPGINP